MYPKTFFENFWNSEIKNQVFVIMPFSEEFDTLWNEAIKPAIEENSVERLVAKRVDNTKISTNILSEILDGVAHSKLIFADISICQTGKWAGQRNGNVMYEIGLSHAIRRPEELVLFKNDYDDINFDISNININQYEYGNIESSKKRFKEIVEYSLKNLSFTKNLLVNKVIREIDIKSYELLDEIRKLNGRFKPIESKTMADHLINIKRDISFDKLQNLGVFYFDNENKDYVITDFGKVVIKNIFESK